MTEKFYTELEKPFKVVMPSSDRATYKSPLNFSDDLQKPFQRWCRYKEGYSTTLVTNLIGLYNSNPNGIILDPFLGSGSTIIGANLMGLNGVGFEVNPFSYHLAKCKTQKYSKDDIKLLNTCSTEVLRKAMDTTIPYSLPKLSFADKVFDKEIEGYYMRIRESIKQIDAPQHIQSLLMLGWISKIEEFCNYRKAGNGLKRKKYKNPKKVTVVQVYKSMSELYANMISDIEEYSQSKDATIYNGSCLTMDSCIKDSSISGIIFSPPYANCFDYTEIYKLELWFGGYIKDYSDLKQLRNTALRSNLNGHLKEDASISTASLDKLVKELEGKDVWDKRIPQMLRLYFSDMFRVLDQCYRVLENNGFCAIVVGNSSYSNIVFPTDLLLAEYADSIGFTVDQIIVDRFIITSSQQYDNTKYLKDYLRESVVCLQKK